MDRRTILTLSIMLALTASPALTAGSTAAASRCDGRLATITGTNGNDVLYGTPGNDVIVGKGGNDRIFGRGGRDYICGGGGVDVIKGGRGHDRLFGGGRSDRIFGQGGKDDLFGGTGAFDVLHGGGGKDFIKTGDGIVKVAFGGGGKDVIKGGNGNDILNGEAGDDKILGKGGDDEIDGGPGDDVCRQGPGNGTIVRCESEADLALSVTALTGNSLGDLVFRVKVKNHGPSDVGDYLVSGAGGDGEDVTCTKFPSPGAWLRGSLEAQATDTFDIVDEYTCVFDDDGDDDDDVFAGFRFRVSHTGEDPVPGNDEATVAIDP